MSNFSDAHDLLPGICEELRLIVRDLGPLAEIAARGPHDPHTLVRLQAFDALTQALEAQARLLSRLGARPSREEALIFLDDLPLPAMRARLRGWLGAETAPLADDSGLLHLFDEGP